MTITESIYITSTNLKNLDLNEIMEIIRTGDYKCSNGESLIENTKGIQAITDHSMQNILKKNLPAVAFNGDFTKITNEGLLNYSSYTAMDFDGFQSEEELQHILGRLKATNCVILAYRTPSGKGLKAIVLHDNTDPSKHTDMYAQLLQKFCIGKENDKSCKDLRRLNYLCYDPNVYYNPDAKPYHYVPSAVAQTKEVKPMAQRDLGLTTTESISDISVLRILKYRCKKYHPDYLEEGSRRDGVFWFGLECKKAIVAYSDGLEFVKELYASSDVKNTSGPMAETEIEREFKNGYNTATEDVNYRNLFKKKG